MDFRKFYDEQSEYTAFRNDPEKREEYIIKVNWKAEQLIKVIRGDLKFDNILEIGCAMGILLNIISDKLSISKRIGLDISEGNIKVAKELYPESTFYQGTLEEFAEKIPNIFPIRKFDVVLLSDIIEHIPCDKGFMVMVRNITSYVLINLPLEKCYKNRHRQYGENDHSGHLRCYDRKMAENLIISAGFEIVWSSISNALTDKIYFDIYQKERRKRVNKKPLHLRLFWTIFYFTEDKIRLFNKGIYEKIYGANYFALLKSKI